VKKFASNLRNLSRNKKLIILVMADFNISFFCWIVFGPPLTFLIATNFEISLMSVIKQNFASFLVPVVCLFIYFTAFGFYRSLMKFFDSKDSIFRAIIGSFIFGFTWAITYINQYDLIRTQFLSTVILQAFLLSSVLYAFIQISRDIAGLILYPKSNIANSKPILIYGAGSAGNELYQAIKVNPSVNVIGFYDNSFNLKGTEINNIKIYSKLKHIKKLVDKFPRLEIYLAIPSLSMSERREIISSLEKFKIAVRSIPALHEIVADEKKMVEIQDLTIDDILPRSRVRQSNISFQDTNVLITGAGGSIGSEIVRQVLSGKAKKIVLFEISEINLYSIESEALAIRNSKKINCEIISILGDVKDNKRLIKIINNHRINSIFHSAAYKHVPIVEYHENIGEGIKNNVFGTNSVCDAALACNVEKVVIISTDKAVRPTNIMGASKRFAEMIAQSADNISDSSTFCMVRFGNVLNSSGSVIPLFRKQIADGGPVTITHKDVTRFFMTISEASSLVIQASEYAEGGDVFILDMGDQVKIFELAKKLIYLSGRNIDKDNTGEGISIKEIGLRPGEKLFEELLISGKEIKTSNSKIFKSIENFPKRDELNCALAELEDSVKDNDVKNIKKILIKHVEGFGNAVKI
tara:strand:- start:410 stop:2320 length:1911 start_codon:yes stop_codon:yes gene_type:complete